MNNQNYFNNPFLNNSNNSNLIKIKEQQELKQLEKLNQLENKYNKDKIKESVIKPIKIEKDNRDIKKDYNSKEKEYFKERDELWKIRTNQPYKNIIKDEQQVKKFINRNNIDKSELIVHKVTNLDKQSVDKEYSQFKNKLETHNNELKVIYSTNKQAEHKKQFEYNHKYKYRIKYDPSDHNKLKQDKIEMFKKEQQKEEENKQKIDNIIENLINNGIFNKEELEEIGIKNNNDNSDNNSNNSKKEKYIQRQKK